MGMLVVLVVLLLIVLVLVMKAEMVDDMVTLLGENSGRCSGVLVVVVI